MQAEACRLQSVRHFLNPSLQASSMSARNQDRRRFLKQSATAAAAGVTAPYWFTSARPAFADYRNPNDRPVVGCIGTGDRWGNRKSGEFSGGVANLLMQYADVAAVCDVDGEHRGLAQSRVSEAQSKKGRQRKVDAYEDYRELLDRDDIEAVTIVTVDHWHTKIAIEALKAGKDVYCEKPLTLTIDEGRQIIKALEGTDRVFQVGTQQRTESEQRFLKAIAIARAGRLGDIRRVTCTIGGAPVSESIPAVATPKDLNWDMWLGQCPMVDFRYKDSDAGKYYTRTRAHLGFRWWYEYSGGRLTDWGAHHIDIAQWLIDQMGPQDGPTKITPVVAEHPVELDEMGNPTRDDMFNTSNKFSIRADFPNGVEMMIESDGRNGILVEGTKGRIFVNRGTLAGKPVEDLAGDPLPDDAVQQVYGGPVAETHMANFMNCIKTRETPISDVWTHQKTMTTCHLAAIAARLNRPLTWDAKTETIVGDEIANAMQARKQRKGYEIKV